MAIFFVFGVVVLTIAFLKEGRSQPKQLALSPNYKKVLDAFLDREEPYYRLLSPAGKEKFILQLILFKRSKKWVPRHGIRIDEEMKWVVSAAATGSIEFRAGLSTRQSSPITFT